MITANEITLTRVNNDVNGNPRYVTHFLNFITAKDGYGSGRYELALKRAKSLGGKKFHNKQYGGGIVFQSYNTTGLKNDICELVNKL